MEGVTLELQKISRLDMGVYLCIASNGVPPTVSKRIFVSVDCKCITHLVNYFSIHKGVALEYSDMPMVCLAGIAL